MVSIGDLYNDLKDLVNQNFYDKDESDEKYMEKDDFGIQIDEDGILTVVPLSDANVYAGDLYATKSYVDNHVFSGSYDDLDDKPSIPEDLSDLTDTNGLLPTDSGWVNLTVNGNFYNYTENSQTVQPLQYRKSGNVVEVIGFVALNANLTVGEWTIGNLPSDCRPTRNMSFICELANNANLWTCIVKTNGDITFNRLRDISSTVTTTVTYTDTTTDTVNLSVNDGFISGTQFVDVLKINVMFFV